MPIGDYGVTRYEELIDPCNPASLLVMADRCEESGRVAEASSLRRGVTLPFFLYGYGYGYGEGYGYGYRYRYAYGYGDEDGYGGGFGEGEGFGDGEGYGYWYGYGDGYRYGYGEGYGVGYGYGEGYGEGVGRGLFISLGGLNMDELVVGQAYMWMVGNGWMFIGRFVRRDGLHGAVVRDPVNICRTGGTSWPELCRGRGRQNATFERYDPVTHEGTPFPFASPFMKWEGDLPLATRDEGD
jgi:hypothetical protein